MSSEYILRTHTQPCWFCTKACGGCSWSKNFTPIKNWVAEKVMVDRYIYEDKETIIESYKILHCPEFVDERLEYIRENITKRPYKIAEELHIGLATTKRLIRQIKLENKSI